MPLATLALLLAACGGAAGGLQNVGAPLPPEAARGGDGAEPGFEGAPSAAPAAPQEGSGGVPTDDGVPPSALRDEAKVVYTGSLELVVADLQAALAQARAMVAATGGYIGASEESDDGEVALATITYRIPAARWEDAVADLRELATRVVGERTQATEVGGQIVDLEARVRNLRASETVLVGIAEGTGRVSDLLEVQARITEVRGQIEQLEAQRLRLEDQAAYGTLVTTFGTEVEQVEVAARGWDPRSDVDGATATLIGAAQAVVSAAIWLGIVWLPVILLVALAALALRWVVRRAFPGTSPRGPIGGWGQPGG
jgi:hypothetical protein